MEYGQGTCDHTARLYEESVKRNTTLGEISIRLAIRNISYYFDCWQLYQLSVCHSLQIRSIVGLLYKSLQMLQFILEMRDTCTAIQLEF